MTETDRLCDSLSNPPKIDYNYSSVYELTENLACKSNYATFCNTKNGNVCKMNLTDFTLIPTQMENPHKLDYFCNFCQLPNNEIFGFSCFKLGTFIIKADLSFQKLKRSAKPTSFCGSIYYEGYVYIFGGSGNNYERFNLVRHIWTKLPKLPRTSDYTSCAILQNKILITGYHLDNIYVFNPDINSYTRTLKALKMDTQKLVCNANQRGFLIELPGDVYESDVNDPYK